MIFPSDLEAQQDRMWKGGAVTCSLGGERVIYGNREEDTSWHEIQPV